MMYHEAVLKEFKNNSLTVGFVQNERSAKRRDALSAYLWRVDAMDRRDKPGFVAYVPGWFELDDGDPSIGLVTEITCKIPEFSVIFRGKKGLIIARKGTARIADWFA